jgi:hypothetical protein
MPNPYGQKSDVTVIPARSAGGTRATRPQPCRRPTPWCWGTSSPAPRGCRCGRATPRTAPGSAPRGRGGAGRGHLVDRGAGCAEQLVGARRGILHQARHRADIARRSNAIRPVQRKHRRTSATGFADATQLTDPSKAIQKKLTAATASSDQTYSMVCSMENRSTRRLQRTAPCAFLLVAPLSRQALLLRAKCLFATAIVASPSRRQPR